MKILDMYLIIVIAMIENLKNDKINKEKNADRKITTYKIIKCIFQI